MHEPSRSESPVAPAQAVGTAIQDLTASRLGKGFIPLAILALTAIVASVRGAGDLGAAMLLGMGALAAGGAMLAYGLRISQIAFGREPRLWMNVAMLASVIPPFYALYVLAWRGLRGFVVASGIPGLASAFFFTLVGAWTMRGWMRVVEVERLAKVMAGSVGGGE